MNTYLLLFTIRGQGEIATPPQRFSVPAGCAALMDGNTWHRYACQGELWEMAWIHFCGGGVPAYLSYLFDAGEQAVAHQKLFPCPLCRPMIRNGGLSRSL